MKHPDRHVLSHALGFRLAFALVCGAFVAPACAAQTSADGGADTVQVAPECTAAYVGLCQCPSGADGVRVCHADGFFGPCACVAGAGSCESDCSGRQCGLDPKCGASCGTCGDSETCEGAKCVPKTGKVAVAVFCNGVTSGGQPLELRLRVGDAAFKTYSGTCAECANTPAGSAVAVVLEDVATGMQLDSTKVELSHAEHVLFAASTDGVDFDIVLQRAGPGQSCGSLEAEWLKGGAQTDADCSQCVADKCGDELAACQKSNECMDLYSCRQKCAGVSKCLTGCEDQHPGGVAPLLKMSKCALSKCVACN
mgnify:CR=1 FL=1